MATSRPRLMLMKALAVRASMLAALAVPFAAQDPCGATIGSMPVLFFRQGGPGTVQVLAPPACTWSLSVTDTWVTFTSPAGGTGNGSVQFEVAPLASGGRVLQMMLTGAVPRTISQTANIFAPALIESPSEWRVVPDPVLVDLNTAYPPFDLHGWAIDQSASFGPGYDAVQVFRNITPLASEFVGQATYGEDRPHVGTYAGSQFGPSGYSLRIQTLGTYPDGTAGLVVRARNTTTGLYESVNSHPRVLVGTPQLKASVDQLRFAVVNTGGSASAATQPQQISIDGIGVDVPWTAVANQPWILLSRTSGIGPSRLAVGIDPGAVQLPFAGQFSGSVEISAPGIPQ